MVSPLPNASDYLCLAWSSNAAAIVHGEIAGPRGDYGTMREEDLAFFAEAFAERNLIDPRRVSSADLHLLHSGGGTPRTYDVIPLYVPTELTPASGTYLEPYEDVVTVTVSTNVSYERPPVPIQNISEISYFVTATNTYRRDWPDVLVPTNSLVTNITYRTVTNVVTTTTIYHKTFKDYVLKDGRNFAVATSIWQTVNLSGWPTRADITNVYHQLARPHRLLVHSSPGFEVKTDSLGIGHTRYEWNVYNETASPPIDQGHTDNVTNAWDQLPTTTPSTLWTASAYTSTDSYGYRSAGQHWDMFLFDTEPTLYIELPDNITNIAFAAGSSVTLAALYLEYSLSYAEKTADQSSTTYLYTNFIQRVDGASIELDRVNMKVRASFPFVDPYASTAQSIGEFSGNYAQPQDVSYNDIGWTQGSRSIYASVRWCIVNYIALIDCQFRTDIPTNNGE